MDASHNSLDERLTSTSEAASRAAAAAQRDKEKERHRDLRFDGSSRLGERPKSRLVKLPDFYIRELRPMDRDQLVALHIECFPVSYESQFFDKSVQGQLFSRVVAVSRQTLQPGSPLPCGDRMGGPDLLLGGGGGGNGEDMAGVIISQVSPHAEFEDVVLDAGCQKEDRVAYICTLGVWDKYRQHGLAAKLLKILIDWAEADPSIKAISLHVLTSNRVALYFYEKNGFTRLRRLADFYTINGKQCDAYLYVRHINGGTPPSTWLLKTLQTLKRPLVSACLATSNQVISVLRRLGICGMGSAGSTCGGGVITDSRSPLFVDAKKV